MFAAEAMSFQTLPNELVVEIGRKCNTIAEASSTSQSYEIHVTFNPTTLAALARCSKRLHGLLTPLLYSWYSSGEFRRAQDAMEMALFCRTIFKAPHLAMHVRTLSIIDPAGKWWEEHLQLSEDLRADDAFWDCVRATLAKIPAFMDEEDMWLSLARLGSPDILATALMISLPNVENLEIVVHVLWPMSLMEAAFDQDMLPWIISEGKRHHPRRSEIWVYEGSGGSASPVLRSMFTDDNTHSDKQGQRGDGLNEIMTKPKVRHLSIESAGMREAGFGKLLALFPSLKRLDVHVPIVYRC